MIADRRLAIADWNTVTLGEIVADAQYGTSVKANEQGEGIPILRMNNITYRGGIDLTDLKHVELPVDDLEQYSVRRGDLLFNRTNSQELVGKMGVWNRDEQFAFAGYLVRLRLKPDRADPAFVGAWFNTPEMKALLRTRAKPSINMSNINATEVLKFPVVLPPLAEQRRIAEVLDRAEALRAKRRAALAQLDSLTQSLFLDLFGDPEGKAKRFPYGVLDDSCSFLSGFAWKADRFSKDPIGLPIIRIQNVDAVRDSDFIYWPGDYQERFVMRRGDLLLTLSGSFRIAEWAGPDALLNQRIVRIETKPGVERLWLLHAVRLLVAKIEALGRHALVNNVALSDLKQLPLVRPPIALQREFARRVTAVEALKTAQRASLAELDALFASLQHRAFRGEL